MPFPSGEGLEDFGGLLPGDDGAALRPRGVPAVGVEAGGETFAAVPTTRLKAHADTKADLGEILKTALATLLQFLKSVVLCDDFDDCGSGCNVCNAYHLVLYY